MRLSRDFVSVDSQSENEVDPSTSPELSSGFAHVAIWSQESVI